MKRLTRLEVGAILIFGAGFAYLIGGEWYARQPEAQGANDMTTGAIATGTQLKREGEAVAELWAIRGIGERASDTVDLTHHLSPVKHLEVLGMLRELQPIDILGHHLPEQTGAWVDDLNSGAHISYQVAFPDGRIMPFTGWVQRVKVTGELAGAITFEATIRPVYAAPEYWHCLTDAPVGVPPSIGPDWEAILAPPGPSWWKCVVPVTSDHLMETPPPVEVLHGHWASFEFPEDEYYHCIDDVLTPGTPPEDDPGHWEEVEAPDRLEEGEAVFGYDQVGGDGNITDIIDPWGIEYVFPSGPPIRAYDWLTPPEGFPNWPASSTASGVSPDTLPGIYCVFDPATNVVTKVVAYFTSASPPDWATAAIYDNAHQLVAHSPTVTVVATAGWVEFPMTATLVPGATYSMHVWCLNPEEPPVGAGTYMPYDVLAAYSPPAGSEWDPDYEYEYCQTVYLPPPDVVWYSWDPRDIYSLNDVVRYLPVYPEWEDDVQYKWCNWIHYKRPQ